METMCAIMRIRSLLVPLALASILSAPVEACAYEDSPGQVPAWLRPHAPIRLTLLRKVDNRPLVGEFLEGRGDSIRMCTRYPQRDLALPLDEVGRLEVSRERSPRTWDGARVGFLGGALLGVAAGASEGHQQGDTGARIVVDAITLGCLGMALGAVAGHSTKADHWTVIWSRTDER